MKENDIIDLIEKEYDWEEVLEYIITEKGLDPWEIDLVKLANIFAEKIKNLKEVDFKIPARLIIILAILLRMKVEILMWHPQGESEEEMEIESQELELDISSVPNFQTPVKRKPRRKVTLDELTYALKKAFRTQRLRETRKKRRRRNVEETVNLESSEDISEKIDDLYERIVKVVDNLKENKLKFSSLVPSWNRDEIVKSFLPLLHLSTDGKVSCEQEKVFEEIFIKILEKQHNS